MSPEQINAVYQNLCQRTGDSKELRHQLGMVENNFTADEAVLYLPMYSMGIGQAGISRRIATLRRLPFTVEDLAKGKCTEAQVEGLDIGGGDRFGMPNRVKELFSRAKEMSAYGVEKLSSVIEPKPNWSLDDLVEPFTLLHSFTGVADKAALHILMDLGWGVVKPDRHICRFLSRLGGPWKRYFPSGETDGLRAGLTLPFVRDWRDTCRSFALSELDAPPEAEGVRFPPVARLTSRQVDILIMWFAQDRAKAEHKWRPKPICGKKPNCKDCPVEGCEGRVEPFVDSACRP